MNESDLPLVLVVDDEPVNIEIMAEILEQDYQVLFATDANTTLNIVERCNPQLILLDIMMPDMNGIDLCRQLKSNPHYRDIPIIFVTALNHKIDETEGLEAGAIDYVTKPIVAPVLKARVRNQIELKQLRDELAQFALRDALTGLSNRRSFDETFAMEWRRAKRMGTVLSLIMVDVDYFKDFNDYHGHIEGDFCLKEIAKVFSNTINRSHDFVARFGGEEFIFILPDTDLHGASVLAEKLRRNVEDERIIHEKSQVSDFITISLGVYTYSPAKDDEQISSERILIELDKQLYQAKRLGRNQLSVYRAA